MRVYHLAGIAVFFPEGRQKLPSFLPSAPKLPDPLFRKVVIEGGAANGKVADHVADEGIAPGVRSIASAWRCSPDVSLLGRPPLRPRALAIDPLGERAAAEPLLLELPDRCHQLRQAPPPAGPASRRPANRLPASSQVLLQVLAGLTVPRRPGPRRSARFRRRSAHRAATRVSGRGSRSAHNLPAWCSPVRNRPAEAVVAVTSGRLCLWRPSHDP